ncbi:MAG: carotenoid biosynthesis protein [Saprospiraceae bacterium]
MQQTKSNLFLTPESYRWPLTVFLLVSSYLTAIILIGFIGYTDFLNLTPFNLLMSMTLLLWGHQPRSTGLWNYLALAYSVGFVAELIGVSSGMVFGAYEYGPVLGWKIWGTPLLIGVNWAMVVYLGNELSNRVLPKGTTAVRVLVGATIPVALDWIIEPVAIHYNMWRWSDAVPPLHNYIGWFIISLILSYAYQRWIGFHKNRVAPLLLGLQILFFLILGLQLQTTTN